MRESIPLEAAGFKADPKKIKAAARKVEGIQGQVDFTNLREALSDDEMRERLKGEFNSEPIDMYLTEMIVDGIHLNVKEALSIDLTEYVRLDKLYRWLNAGDLSNNYTGKPNKGKSNMMLSGGLDWCAITGQPFHMSNIVYQTPLYNLLLRGMKVVPKKDDPEEVDLVNFKQTPGMCLMLDEASDRTVAGNFSKTMVEQTEDMEARMRALQIGRLCAGTRSIMHQSNYDFWALERNPNTRTCTGIVIARDVNDYASPTRFLGYVKVPYVDLNIFQSYNKPKMDSIHGYARSVGTNIVAKVMRSFANELKKDAEYQKLPIRPPAQRINYIESHDRYAIFQTINSFKTLEMLSRPDKKKTADDDEE